MISTFTYTFQQGTHSSADTEKVRGIVTEKITKALGQGGFDIESMHFTIEDDSILKVTTKVKHGPRNL